jgi:hypothetical protein
MMPPMARPRAAWLTSLGLLGVGWVTAHVVSYVLFVPRAERGEVLAHTGHGYFRPTDLIVLSVLVALAGVLAVGLGYSPGRVPSPYVLGSIPPIGFIVQEHAERIVSGGAFHLYLVAEPRFLVGLLLQIPFALAALLFARVLVTFARALGEGRGGMPRPKLMAVVLAWAPRLELHPPLPSALALGRSERAPPPAATR